MASSTAEKLQSLIECPICMLPFTNPKALNCLHFYCGPCIDNFKLVTKDEKIGYDCPLCRQFTIKDELHPMRFVEDLLEVFHQSKKEQTCDLCKKEVLKWRCLNCKENYCKPCRANHDSHSMLKNHKWEEIHDESKAVLDKHEYCLKHPDELVKFYCDDCNQLICMLCNGTTHKLHSAKTIGDALRQLIPVLKGNRDKVANLITIDEKTLAEAEAHSEKLKQEAKQTEREIDSRCDEIIAKALQDAMKLKDELSALKEQQLSVAGSFIENLRLRLKSQKNIVKLSDTMLSTAQGTSLLQAIQSGLNSSLTSFLTEDGDSEVQIPGSSATFEAETQTDDNMIGKVELQVQIAGSSTVVEDEVLKDSSGLGKVELQFAGSSTVAIEGIALKDNSRVGKVGLQVKFARSNTESEDEDLKDGSGVGKIDQVQVAGSSTESEDEDDEDLKDSSGVGKIEQVQIARSSTQVEDEDLTDSSGFGNAGKVQSAGSNTEVEEDDLTYVSVVEAVELQNQLPPHSMYVPMRLTGLNKLEVKSARSFSLSFPCRRFDQVQNNLWCVEQNTKRVHICSMNGEIVRTLTFEDIGGFRSIQATFKGAVIASTEALILVDENGEKQSNLLKGLFCDVSVVGSTVYALENNTRRIEILERNPEKTHEYVQKPGIQLLDYYSCTDNTIQATEDYLYVTKHHGATLQQYNLNGQLVKNGLGPTLGENRMLCGADMDGVVLLADTDNNCFHAIDPQGECVQIEIEGLKDGPRCGLFTQDKFIVSLYTQEIQEFVLK